MSILLFDKLEFSRDTLDKETKKRLAKLKKALKPEEEKDGLQTIRKEALKECLLAFIKTAAKQGNYEIA